MYKVDYREHTAPKIIQKKTISWIKPIETIEAATETGNNPGKMLQHQQETGQPGQGWQKGRDV